MKGVESTFQSLLQRIQKQYCPTKQEEQEQQEWFMERPPDEAAFALGGKLGLAFCELIKSSNDKTINELQTTVFQVLTRVNHPSILQSFLQTVLQTSTMSSSIDWITTWIVKTEETFLENSVTKCFLLDDLTTMIRAYAKISLQQQQQPSNNTNEIAKTYLQLQSSAARFSMLRECTNVAISNHGMKYYKYLLSPLMAACVLGGSKRREEAVLFLDTIWKQTWVEFANMEEDVTQETIIMDLLEWMTLSLNMFLRGIRAMKRIQDQIASKEMAFRWLNQILELASVLVQDSDDKKDATIEVSLWLSKVVTGTLPRLYYTVSNYRIPFRPILVQINFILQEMKTANFVLRPHETHALATMILSNPIKDDANELLKILTVSIATTNSCIHPVIYAMLTGIGSILGRDTICASSSSELTLALKRNKQSTIQNSKFNVDLERTKSILQMVVTGADDKFITMDNIVKILSNQRSMLDSSQFTTAQQSGALLLAIGFLDQSVIGRSKETETSVNIFIDNLLARYPHLGVSFLPIVVEAVNTSSIRGDGDSLMRSLHFLCDTIIKDPTCASEVWSLLGVELMKDDVPVAIRSSVIRLFPEVCAANKRLYKRIISAMGKCLAALSGLQKDGGESAELRLAIAATLADLAKEDLIRDVTDVVGWIQGFIVDSGWVRSVSTLDNDTSAENAALVHFAILSLHHLVEGQELDYPVVIAVLKKRLCNIHDVNETVKLPPLVLETLVLLLGDGEADNDSDDSDDDQEVGVPLQIRLSVETLIQLALAEELSPLNALDSSSQIALLRCRRNIYTSLSKYSIEALGLDEEGVQAVSLALNDADAPALSDSGRRYNALKKVIHNGIRDLKDHDTSESLVLLISKILRLEEESLGSTLWQKRGYPKKEKRIKSSNSSVESLNTEALPSVATIQRIHRKNRSAFTSLSTMLCFEGKSLSKLTALAENVTVEYSDPLIHTLAIQAWLNASRSLLTELIDGNRASEDLDKILREIHEWSFQFDVADNMYLALSTLALYIPDILGAFGDFSPYVDKICDEVYRAYRDQEFENPDTGKLCLSFTGVCLVRDNDALRADEVISLLERSITSYGGKASFGACFGLGIIAQSFPHQLQEGEREGRSKVDLGYTRRIIGILLDQLISCIKGKFPVLHSLLTCVENGHITPEVIDDLVQLRKQKLELVTSKRGVAKTLLITFALCIPALAPVNDELLLGMYCLIDSLPWGSGKGFALPSVLRICSQCDIFEASEIEDIYANYTKSLEDGMGKSSDGLDDIAYAVTATTRKISPLYSENGSCTSLMSAIASIGSLPCLGHGADSFTQPPYLFSAISTQDVQSVGSMILEAVEASDIESSNYSLVALLLMGYMASMKSYAESTASSAKDTLSKQRNVSILPTALHGTVLEIIVPTLTQVHDAPSETASQAVVSVLGCLETLSLPGHFAKFLDQLIQGSNKLKYACTELMIAQIDGRPRAVFDGREYLDLAIKVAMQPPAKLRSSLGEDTTLLFLQSFSVIMSKVPASKMDSVMENVWQLCIKEASYFPNWTSAFLYSIKSFLMKEKDAKGAKVSPKTLKTIQTFVMKRVFSGIRDATWSPMNTSVVYDYASCLEEIPLPTLVEAEFLIQRDYDGFVGEALRHRLIMILAASDYFKKPSKVSNEIQNTMAWFIRRLLSPDSEIFSSTTLHVCCSIATATHALTSKQKNEILLAFLDNLLLIEANESIVGLQILGALLCQWCKGIGSDGDLSLTFLCLDGWQELSQQALRQLFDVLVRDLPFNLAHYSKKEEFTSVVCNHLWRLYNKWNAEDSPKVTIECLRQALICCRMEDSVEHDDFPRLATSILNE